MFVCSSHQVLLAARVISLAVGGWLGNARLALALYAGTGFIVYSWVLVWLVWESGASVRLAVWAIARIFVYAIPGLLILAMAKWWWQWPDWSLLVVAGLGGLLYYGIAIRQDSALLQPLANMMGRSRAKSQ